MECDLRARPPLPDPRSTTLSVRHPAFDKTAKTITSLRTSSSVMSLTISDVAPIVGIPHVSPLHQQLKLALRSLSVLVSRSVTACSCPFTGHSRFSSVMSVMRFLDSCRDLHRVAHLTAGYARFFAGGLKGRGHGFLVVTFLPHPLLRQSLICRMALISAYRTMLNWAGVIHGPYTKTARRQSPTPCPNLVYPILRSKRTRELPARPIFKSVAASTMKVRKAAAKVSTLSPPFVMYSAMSVTFLSDASKPASSRLRRLAQRRTKLLVCFPYALDGFSHESFAVFHGFDGTPVSPASQRQAGRNSVVMAACKIL